MPPHTRAAPKNTAATGDRRRGGVLGAGSYSSSKEVVGGGGGGGGDRRASWPGGEGLGRAPRRRRRGRAAARSVGVVGSSVLRARSTTPAPMRASGSRKRSPGQSRRFHTITAASTSSPAPTYCGTRSTAGAPAWEVACRRLAGSGGGDDDPGDDVGGDARAQDGEEHGCQADDGDVDGRGSRRRRRTRRRWARRRGGAGGAAPRTADGWAGEGSTSGRGCPRPRASGTGRRLTIGDDPEPSLMRSGPSRRHTALVMASTTTRSGALVVRVARRPRHRRGLRRGRGTPGRRPRRRPADGRRADDRQRHRPRRLRRSLGGAARGRWLDAGARAAAARSAPIAVGLIALGVLLLLRELPPRPAGRDRVPGDDRRRRRRAGVGAWQRRRPRAVARPGAQPADGSRRRAARGPRRRGACRRRRSCCSSPGSPCSSARSSALESVGRVGIAVVATAVGARASSSGRGSSGCGATSPTSGASASGPRSAPRWPRTSTTRSCRPSP